MRAHGILLAALQACMGVPSSPPVRFLVRAGGFPAWLGQMCGLQGSAISTEELAELRQSPRKGIKHPGQQNPSSSAAACPGLHLDSPVSTPAQALPEASPACCQQLSHHGAAPGEGPAELSPPHSPILSRGC